MDILYMSMTRAIKTTTSVWFLVYTNIHRHMHTNNVAKMVIGCCFFVLFPPLFRASKMLSVCRPRSVCTETIKSIEYLYLFLVHAFSILDCLAQWMNMLAYHAKMDLILKLAIESPFINDYDWRKNRLLLARQLHSFARSVSEWSKKSSQIKQTNFGIPRPLWYRLKYIRIELKCLLAHVNKKSISYIVCYISGWHQGAQNELRIKSDTLLRWALAQVAILSPRIRLALLIFLVLILRFFASVVSFISESDLDRILLVTISLFESIKWTGFHAEIVITYKRWMVIST